MHATLDDYRVNLDCYSGPLDLLLFLVKRHEVDLNDLPIAQLTDQYLTHLKLIEQINLDVAGEFLVMAATLLEIKSRMIAPRPEQDDEQADDLDLEQSDPRHELVQQLLAYKRYKDAALALEERRSEWEKCYPLMPTRLSKADQQEGADAPGGEAALPREIDLEDVNILDLCEAFAKIMEAIGTGPSTHEVVYDDTPIELHAEDIYDRLLRDGAMSLQKMFIGRTSRSEMIGLFLATLELVRRRRVRIHQDAQTGEIDLSVREEEPELVEDESRDWRDPETGEVQYDWPNEQARRRAERREKIRATRARHRQEASDAQNAATTPDLCPEESLEIEGAGEDDDEQDLILDLDD